jgi:cobalt-zinc-cadmium efflux system membrane fusion protein
MQESGVQSLYKERLFISLAFVCLCFSSCLKQESASEKHAIEQNPNLIKLSASAAKLAAIKSFTVGSKANISQIETTGQIRADENRVFHINSIVAGRVVKDNVVLGKVIREGDELAVIQNLDLARTYGDYIHQAHQNEIDVEEARARLDLANKNVERISRLSKEGIVAEKDVFQTQNQQKLLQIELSGLQEHAIHIRGEAQALLSAFGINLDEIERKGIDPHEIKTGSPLLSPRAGVVIQKNVTVGDVVNPAQPLYVVADLSQVWLDISIYDKDLEKVKEGQSVAFHSDSLPTLNFMGKISYIQPSAGDGTRTFLARASLPNPHLVLKPGMFGQIKITGIGAESRPFLPDEAIQRYGHEEFVFLDLGNNTYIKRVVALGERLGDGNLVSSGIKSGDKVVGSGSFKLKSELLKSEISNED